MPADASNLMEKVYDLFSQSYASTTGGGAFLAFEMGVPFTTDMYTLNGVLSPSLAIESQSQIANAALEVDGDFVHRTTRTVDGQVGFMLLASMPIDADATVTLGAVKRPASQAFDVTLRSYLSAF